MFKHHTVPVFLHAFSDLVEKVCCRLLCVRSWHLCCSALMCCGNLQLTKLDSQLWEEQPFFLTYETLTNLVFLMAINVYLLLVFWVWFSDKAARMLTLKFLDVQSFTPAHKHTAWHRKKNSQTDTERPVFFFFLQISKTRFTRLALRILLLLLGSDMVDTWIHVVNSTYWLCYHYYNIYCDYWARWPFSALHLESHVSIVPSLHS